MGYARIGTKPTDVDGVFTAHRTAHRTLKEQRFRFRFRDVSEFFPNPNPGFMVEQSWRRSGEVWSGMLCGCCCTGVSAHLQLSLS